MRRPLMLGLVLATAGCYGTCSSSDKPATTATAGGFSGIPARHYGLGRAATPAEVAALNVDVAPDGAGLPTGSGSVAQGADLFQKKCAMCHGPKGQGMPPAFPLLISRDPKAEGFKFASDFKLPHSIGNYWPEATTVFDYVRRAMPLLQPGSLTNNEVYSLTAFLLAANEVIPMSATLDSASLVQVKMPYRDRFVPDDRRGGKEVK
ncbi:MAG TPA: c-type cytochrome [Gemmatimonadaceae bacterium]